VKRTHKWRPWLAVGLAGVAVLAIAANAVAGGSVTRSARATQAKDVQITIGYASPFLFDVGQVVIRNAIDAAVAKAPSLKLLQPTNANNDAGQQVTDVHNLINAGAKGLIIGPVDTKAIIPALGFASSKHVPVVTTDKGPSGGKVFMIVRADNLLMGKLDCEAVGKAIGGTGKVISLDGAQSDLNGHDRTSGFVDCMKKQFPNVQVIQELTNWVAATGADALQTALTANPDTKAIYLQSDSVFLAGTLAVLHRLHKDATAGHSGHIFLATIDGTPQAIAAIRKHQVDVLVSQPLTDYGKWGVWYLQQALAGKTFKAGPTTHGSHIITFQGNLMDLLPSPVVTLANANDPKLWGNQVKVK
jgi:ribose transport system substrate-binding protein